jgi:hypothetical protein
MRNKNEKKRIQFSSYAHSDNKPIFGQRIVLSKNIRCIQEFRVSSVSDLIYCTVKYSCSILFLFSFLLHRIFNFTIMVFYTCTQL